MFGVDEINREAALHCESWQNPDAAVPAVIQGTTGYTDERWYAAVTGACSDSARVLCVER